MNKEIKRYDLGIPLYEDEYSMIPNNTGDYVKYEDYLDAIESERLKSEKLEQWKKQMLEVWLPIDNKIRPLCKLGESVSKKTVSLIEQNDRLRGALERILHSMDVNAAFIASQALKEDEECERHGEQSITTPQGEICPFCDKPHKDKEVGNG